MPTHPDTQEHLTLLKVYSTGLRSLSRGAGTGSLCLHLFAECEDVLKGCSLFEVTTRLVQSVAVNPQPNTELCAKIEET